MIRRFTPLALVATVVLAACGTQGAPEIEDPREILTQSVEAMAEIESVHFLLALDGSVNVAEMGGEFSLNGTELEGSLAMDGSAGQISFAVPAFLGLSGEMLLVGQEAFIKTSMTGPLWLRQEVVEDSDDPLSQVGDPQAALDELETFLDEEGVELEKLEDVECGDATCYHLRIDIAGEVFLNSDEAAEADPEMLGTLGETGMSFDIQIAKDTLYLVAASTSIEDETMGAIELSITFDGFGDPVEVEAPPSDEVTDDAGGFPIP